MPNNINQISNYDLVGLPYTPYEISIPVIEKFHEQYVRKHMIETVQYVQVIKNTPVKSINYCCELSKRAFPIFLESSKGEKVSITPDAAGCYQLFPEVIDGKITNPDIVSIWVPLNTKFILDYVTV